MFIITGHSIQLGMTGYLVFCVEKVSEAEFGGGKNSITIIIVLIVIIVLNSPFSLCWELLVLFYL